MRYNTQILMTDNSMESMSFSAEDDASALRRLGKKWHTRLEKTADGCTWHLVHPGYKPGTPAKPGALPMNYRGGPWAMELCPDE